MKIEKLQTALQPLQPEDTMPEAGRKILLEDFITMLNYEDGARSGGDIEDLHKMRVATRRMRSALRLLGDYYKPKVIKPFVKQLKTLADKLGKVRDLDVMIHDLRQLPNHELMTDVFTELESQRKVAREQLASHLDSVKCQTFFEKFAKFASKPGKGAQTEDEDDGVIPYQIRHILPVLIHDHLAIVKAYDTVLAEADIHTLHALRIAFKRLRYAISYFKSLLGSSIDGFADELKTMQEYLGRLNDVHVAQMRLSRLPQQDILQQYIHDLAEEEVQLIAGFGEVWTKFNSRTVQRKLSDALLVLR